MKTNILKHGDLTPNILILTISSPKSHWV